MAGRVGSLGAAAGASPAARALAAALAGSLAIEVERRRLLPWGAVLFGCGILLFFARADGPVAPALVAAALAALLAVALRARFAASLACAGLAFLAAGYGAAGLRQAAIAAPALVEPRTGRVAGFVEAIEEREDGGARIVLRILADAPPTRGEGPLRARLAARDAGDLSPGDWIVATARLLPPPEAVRPGGYDFAKEAYFRGIGAVGSFAGRPVAAQPPQPPGLRLALAAEVDRLRNEATARIARTIGGQAGAVAAALVTGKRGLIAEETNEALRAAGVYHVVSISGLHMALAAGVVFFGVRALLALSPALALRLPIKKIAAAAAILAGALYCVFSGAAVATVRALIMTGIMLAAVIADRPALSMRNLALAALVVLALEPEALVGPSFQMSFAAVAGLIAAAEREARRPPRPGPRPGPIGRALRGVRRFLVGVVATTVIATLATGPFAAYHFNLANPYALLGNVLALPVVSFLVMPAAVLAVALMPLGADAPALAAMGFGVAQVLAISEAVAALPGARVVAPSFGAEALALFSVAILVATLCVSRLRRLAAVPALAGLVLAASPRAPDLYVDRDGRGFAARGADGRLVVVGDPGEFVLAQWLRADGDARDPADPSLAGGACDPLGCVAALPGGGFAALVRDGRAFAEDCGRARVVVSPLRAPPGCAPDLLLDRPGRARTGAVAVRALPDGLAIDAVRRDPETRPWLTRQ